MRTAQIDVKDRRPCRNLQGVLVIVWRVGTVITEHICLFVLFWYRFVELKLFLFLFAIDPGLLILLGFDIEDGMELSRHRTRSARSMKIEMGGSHVQ